MTLFIPENCPVCSAHVRCPHGYVSPQRALDNARELHRAKNRRIVAMVSDARVEVVRAGHHPGFLDELLAELAKP